MSTFPWLFWPLLCVLLWSHGYTLGRTHGVRSTRRAWMREFHRGRQSEREDQRKEPV